jgi:acetyl esterase/lipase
MSWLFLVATLVGAWFTYNAFRPTFRPSNRAAASFFAGWLTAELALHHVGWQLLATLLWARAGGLGGLPGRLGLAITLLSWAGLVVCYLRGRAAGDAVERALREALGADYRSTIRPDLAAKLSVAIDPLRLVRPFRFHHPEVERLRDIKYHRAAGVDLRLDVYRHVSRPRNCPVLLEIHGGGWMIGSKNQQGLPLMLRMAAEGWLCVSINYRLSPHATFPDHLVDCKRAIEWIRKRGAEYGADPGFIVVTGQSAGGHLTALIGLTANDPAYQPGFESADTRVAAAIPVYGVYDFTDRFGFWPNDGLRQTLEKYIVKGSLEEIPDAWAKASPMNHIHPEAPPFFVIHGDLDSLVPVAEARKFVAMLREVSRAPVLYAEIPGAQHAFEIFYSLRSELTIGGAERFLAYTWSRALEEREAHVAEAEAPAAVAQAS